LPPKLILFILLFCGFRSYSQSSIDSILDKIDPEKWSASVEKKVSKPEDKIISKTERYKEEISDPNKIEKWHRVIGHG